MQSPGTDASASRKHFQLIRSCISTLLMLLALYLLWAYRGQGLLADYLETTTTWQALVLATLLYAFMLSVPFLPGLELGWLIMGLFGAPGILAAWLGTLAGLVFGFLCARHWPTLDLPARLHSLRQKLALAQSGKPSVPARLSNRVLSWQEHHPYLFVLVALNLPGNLLLGGGGGIAWLSGMTPGVLLFRFVLTAAAATAIFPVSLLLGLS